MKQVTGNRESFVLFCFLLWFRCLTNVTYGGGNHSEVNWRDMVTPLSLRWQGPLLESNERLDWPLHIHALKRIAAPKGVSPYQLYLRFSELPRNWGIRGGFWVPWHCCFICPFWKWTVWNWCAGPSDWDEKPLIAAITRAFVCPFQQCMPEHPA